MNQHTLVIDDDTVVLYLMEKFIAMAQFSATSFYFQNCDSAIDYLKTNYNEKDQFIIFLDINMKGINGWDFLKIIEDFTQVENTLVFVFTSSTNEEDEEQARANKYVRDFLIKPVLGKDLIELRKKFNL